MLIDANSSIIVLRTAVSNTDIIGYTANTPVVVVGTGSNTAFTNIQHIVVDYTDAINDIRSDIALLRSEILDLTANVASIKTMGANVGFKVMDGYAWLTAAVNAKFNLPYQYFTLNKQADSNGMANSAFPHPEEAYTAFNLSDSNLVVLRDIAANIPPYTTNTGGAAIRASIFVGDNPPEDALPNELWWNTTDGIMYIYYDDGNSTQWVSAMPSF